MRLFVTSAAPLFLAGAALSQSFNIDVGTQSPLPAATFGAAATQPGTWNQVTLVTVGGSQPLVDLNGAATSVTMTLTSAAGLPYDFYFDNAATLGDDHALMDDGVDPAGVRAITFSGLAAGTYDVYTYAWAPDSAAYRTGVSVNGSTVASIGGAWGGTYAVPVTHALNTVAITAGQDIVLNLSVVTTFATFNGIQIKASGTPSVPECPGDTAALCPCSGPGGSGVPNPGAVGAGCANSAFPSGAILTSTGSALDNAGDTLVLTCTNMPGPGLFFQANALIGPILNFNDGVLCAGSGIIRMGVVFPTAGVASYPGGLTPAPIHIAGAPVLAPTPVKHYQCWYRDITVGFCNTQGHNMSNGLALTWAP